MLTIQLCTRAGAPAYSVDCHLTEGELMAPFDVLAQRTLRLAVLHIQQHFAEMSKSDRASLTEYPDRTESLPEATPPSTPKHTS